MLLTHVMLALLSTVTIVSADLQSDLWDFIELVPKTQVAFLAGRHYLFDPKFRTAVSYLRSSKFEALVRDEISKNQDVQNVNDYFEGNIDFNAITRIIRRVVIRLKPAQEYGRVRTLTNFIREVADVLPDDKISNLIQEKTAADPVFSRLFAKLIDPQFKSLVYKARNSKSLTGAFRTLSHNYVDVDLILDIGFQQLNKWSQTLS